MNKHTVGPWKFNLEHKEADYYSGSITTLNNEPLADVLRTFPNPDEDEGPANAQLMAAAPDLLLVIKNMRRAFGTLPCGLGDMMGRKAYRHYAETMVKVGEWSREEFDDVFGGGS